MHTKIRCTSFAIAALLFAACEKQPAEKAPDPSPAAAPAPLSAELKAILAKADKADGAEDKVVHRCAGCALGMDGKAEFSLPVDGYTMHFCKEACREPFQKDPAKSIAAIKVK